MNKNSFYGWFNNILNVLVNIFLFLSLLSCLYVCSLVFDDNIRIYVFVGLVVILLGLLFIFKNKIKSTIKKIITVIDKLDRKKQLLIIICLAIVLKIIYSILFSYDLTYSTDIISKYIKYVNDLVNDSYITKTMGDKYVTLTLHLAAFRYLNIPLHIGMFTVILTTIILIYKTFSNVIGKNKTFIACILYTVMPSTILLSFCPTVEIYLMFYVSLFIYVLYLLLNTKKLPKIILLSLILMFVIFVLRSFGYVGYLLMFIIGVVILLTNSNSVSKYALVGVLIVSVFINNIFYFSISYEWRNKEYLYQDLIYGSNHENGGRFIDGQIKETIEEYLVENNLDDSHENQEAAYLMMINENYDYLLNNPKDLLSLLINKFYVSWGGSHYSIEMLNNETNISKTLFYILLSFNQLVYVLTLAVGLLFNKKENSISIGILELVLILTSIVLLIRESANKYALFMVPFIFVICFSKLKD